MRTLLLDTNIVSYLMKESPTAKLYEPHLRDSRLAISFVTVGELYRWAIVRQWGTKRKLDLEEKLRNYLVIPFDIELCKKWAEVKSIAGLTTSDSDAWIAATALRHSVPLVTHNKRHFENISSLTLIAEEDEPNPRQI
jgi:tRNA(fMet)-specific endonuclease VapC